MTESVEDVVDGTHEAGEEIFDAYLIDFTICDNAKLPFCLTVVSVSDLLVPRREIESSETITTPTVAKIVMTTTSSINVKPCRTCFCFFFLIVPIQKLYHN